MASLRLVTVVGLLAAAAVLGSQAPAQAPPDASKSQKKSNPATDPQPRTDEGWVARQKELNERAKKGGAELVFLGDSITEGWEGGGKEVWDKRYTPRKALNLGVSGDQTQHVLWRLDHGNVDGLAPKAAVVMIGTNNTSAGAGGNTGGGQTAEQIAEGVQAVTDKLKEKLPKTRCCCSRSSRAARRPIPSARWSPGEQAPRQGRRREARLLSTSAPSSSAPTA